MGVVAVIHDDGRTATVTEKTARLLSDKGWRPASEIPAKPRRKTQQRTPTGGPETPTSDDVAPETATAIEDTNIHERKETVQ